MTSIKSKKESPVQLSYSIANQMFILSISYVYDVSCTRLMGKMIADKLCIRNLTPVYKMI
jgi:hypothetical protein